MRNLVVIIDKLLDIVPNDEKELVRILDGAKNTLLYTPPESQYTYWLYLAQIFTGHFCENSLSGPIKLEFKPNSWQDQFYNIWMDK